MSDNNCYLISPGSYEVGEISHILKIRMLIPISIFSDTIPNIMELFQIILTKVYDNI